MLKINKNYKNEKAIEFCNEFIHSNRAKYIFGRNELAESIANVIEIDGFIDDFTNDKYFLGKPIIKIEEVPSDALVVVVVVMGKPLTAEKRVAKFQFDFIDYFSFYKYSGLKIKNIMFWDGMIEDIQRNLNKYNWIYELLFDKESKNQFYNIINFRLSYDINYMRGFEQKEDVQYFEEFLNLQDNEIFVDIGAFDGYTTQEFIKRCPKYKKVFLFEPEDKNMILAKQRLNKYQNIHYFKIGLSNKKETIKFSYNGSSSKISNNGENIINVDCLDNLIDEKVTFIKMDIEGFESFAIDGAKETIKKYHPKLAISVYHKKDDFWKIPQQILSIRDDYNIYLRHYTEGIAETVMFFVPKGLK